MAGCDSSGLLDCSIPGPFRRHDTGASGTSTHSGRDIYIAGTQQA